MHYVYLHISHRSGAPFYVGMAKTNPQRDKGNKTRYERAFAYQKRPQYWKDIAASGYDVEIYKDGLSYDDAANLETELIKLYGKSQDKKGGILCNRCSGAKNPGNNRVEHDCPIRQIEIKTGEVIKVWSNPMEIELNAGYLRTNIIKCCRKKQKTAYGYRWDYANDRSFDSIRASAARKMNSNRLKGVVCINKFSGERKLFEKVSDCASYVALHPSTVIKILGNKSRNKIWDIHYSEYFQY